MLLNIENLSVVFHDRDTPFEAVDEVSLQVDKGEIVGIVGESGSGKSMTAHAVMGLIKRGDVVISGKAEFDGVDLLTMSREQLRGYQGEELSIIFQEPMTSLNPTMKIGKQVEESLRIHTKLSKEERKIRALEAMELAELDEPEKLYDCYPHELSGGMRQRVMIASALVLRPQLLIADEPTTALDVTIQAQVLAMMNDLQRRLGTSMIIITHDLGIVAQTCDDVCVMYAGEVIESGTAEDIFKSDKHHPYTVGLFGSIPSLDVESRRLSPINGLMPDPTDLPKGCHFSPRCPHCTEACLNSKPAYYENGTQKILCHLFHNEGGESV